MSRQPIAITSDWDYQVEKVPAFTPEGKATGSFMTRRVDNGTILKVGVTKDYNVVQNRELVQPVEDVLSDLGLEPTERKAYVMKNGERMRMRYIFREEQVKIPKVGDTMGFRMDVDNSFNLSHRIRTIGGAERLVCTNGMTTLDKEHGIACKHSNKFNVNSVINAIKAALEGFRALGDDDNIYTQMAGVEVDQEQGLTILQNLTNKNVISELRRESIARLWNSPDYSEDEGRNLYNLHNAVTQFATHELAETNFEMSERIGLQVTKTFSEAARSEASLVKLWTPKEEPLVQTVDLAAN
jgi:hypothetical protein